MNHSITFRPTGSILCLILFLGLAVTTRNAAARINLDVLQNDGYGMVELKRPDPNVLTVVAEVNGHKLRLIVDTGWGPGGIFLHNDHIAGLGLKTEGVKGELMSASGHMMAGFKAARADRVRLGNVELAGVPVFFGDLRPIKTGANMRKFGADGFLGAGFMKTTSAIVDLQNLRVYLRPPGKGRRAMIGPGLKGAGMAEAAMSGTTVGVELNGSPAKMMVDTGAYHAGIDLRFGEKIKAATRGSNVGLLDAAGKLRPTKLMQVKSFKIGQTSAKVPDLRLTSYGFYSAGGLVGLLGMDILGPNGAIIDFGSEKLYFIPNQ